MNSIMNSIMNNTIIKEFEKLIFTTNEKYKDSKNNNVKFKIMSYRKIIAIIKNLEFEIKDTESIKKIKGVGKSTIEKIDLILKNGYLNFDSTIQEKSDSINENINKLKNLQKITGIGPKKAQNLIDTNITLDILLDAYTTNNKKILENLTHHQLCGVKYYHHLENRIPYDEITEIETYLKSILNKIDNELNLIICGSYRRKCKDSGDIDILLYHNLIQNKKKFNKYTFLFDFLSLLKKNKFIVDDLTTIESPTKYMGFCKLNKYVRRIDIRMVATESLASAMLYFTGSGDFNKKMRTYALKKNYTINEYGIYSIDKDKNKIESLKIINEKDIFDILELDFVYPEDRIPNYNFV